MKTLAELRRERFLSQAELATKANVAKATIANIELGKRTPIGRTARALAEALGVGPGEVVWPTGSA